MQRSPRRPKVSRIGLAVLGLFVVVLVLVGVATYKTLRFVNSVSTASLGDNVRSVVSNVLPAASGSAPAASGTVNVLLLGYGGVGHDGADLTDSIMLLRLDLKTKKAAMISIPRDIWVRIPSNGNQGGFWKLNSAYAIGLDDASFQNKRPEFKGRDGGGNLASYVVGSMLGVKIDYWVAVDFHAFKAVVDALNGVDVDVETAFTDYEYPRNDDPNVDASWMTIHFNAGLQHMNGERAIEYARSRHSLQDGTDFGRSRRQQRLLLAIKDKALSPQGMTKVFGLMDALSKDFSTNMTIGEIKTLADAARGVNPAAIDRVSVDNTNYLVDGETSDGQDVLVPRDKTWAPLRAAVASLFLDPSVKSEAARVQFFNATGVPGLAGTTTALLKEIGLETLPPQNAVASASQETEIHDLSQGRDAATLSYLANYFGAKVLTDPPQADGSADIKVILGKDYVLGIGAGIVDDYDPTVHLLGQAPPAQAAAPKVVPAAKATMEPKSKLTVAAAAKTTVAARPFATAAIKPLATVRPRPTPPKPAPTAAAR